MNAHHPIFVTPATPSWLLVYTGNPAAERLYRRVGIDVVGANTWGGHPMKHMQTHV